MLKKKNNSRYGKIIINKKKIKFLTLGNKNKYNTINAGLYILNRSIFKSFRKIKFSFENFLEKNINYKTWNYVITRSLFLDIGIKKDYLYAKKKIKKFE